MKIPYSKVHVNGDIIFAGRSGQIQTFNLKDGALISTWEHPDVGKVTEAVNKNAEANKAGDDGDNAPKQEEELGKEDEGKQEAEEEDGPPAKRQKTAGGDEKPAAEQNGKSGEGKAAEGQQPTKERKIKKSARSPFRVPERPIVTHLTTTPDGRYLVAVTGHDKAIWVLEHDGKGQLTQLSKRGMPKRLSAVVVTPSASGSDDTSSWQILCADKFGDAYSLPLVPSAATGPYVTRPAARPLKAPAANELTVHSKRNLEALRDQQKQLELDRQRAAGNGQEDQQAPDANDDGKPKKKKKQHKENDHKPEVDFELTLQLGHVSMLTDLVAAEREGRRYIITSDRDEHIRVSRGLPQAHVIEGFCLGHTDFVGAMAVAGPSRPDVLVSGGGDDHLIAWDWHGARQLAKADALALARTVDPDTPHVAISHIYPIVYPGDDGKQTTYIAAISEGVKAILTWQLTDDNTLTHPCAIQLPGTPLSLTTVPAFEGASSPSLIMAMEPDAATPAARSLNVFPLVRDGVRLAVGDAPHDIGDYDYEAADGRAAAHLEASDQEAHGLLYGVGALRKQKILEGEGAPVEEGEEHEGEGEEGQGEDSGAPDQEDTEMA